MSIQAVSWVLEHSTTKGAHRLVLISLANHADDRGQCWPSNQRIATEANITPVHAKRVLAELEKAGHVARAINAAPDSRMRADRRTNLYTLLDGGAQKCPPWLDGGNNDARTGGTSARERGASEVPPNHQENHQKNQTTLVDADRLDSFDDFWKAYPRKVGKPSARRAFVKATTKCPAVKLIARADAFARDPNRLDAYTPHPATWLNDERWDDPPLPPRTGQPARRGEQIDNDRTGTSGRVTV